MTEYATTPSAIEEWKAQRTRTAEWVHHNAAPGLPPTPTSSDSDWEKRSLWDGNGWEPPSDCESSTSVPPTMMLQYQDSRQVLISPTMAEAQLEGSSPRSRHAHSQGHRMNHVYTHGEERRKEEERTERGRSLRSTEQVPPTSVPRSRHSNEVGAGTVPHVQSQTSSMRLARAVAAPLPDSHSSSSCVTGSRGGRSRANGTVHETGSDAVKSASHRATSTHSHPSHVRSNSNWAGTNAPAPNPPMHASQHVPSQPLSHQPSHVPSHVSPHAPSHQPSHQASHPPSYQPSHHPSHVPSHVPPQHPSHQPSHQASHTPSLRPQPSHPPSTFSSHTVTAHPHPAAPSHPPAVFSPPPSAAAASNAPGAPSPPSINSIHSRSISLADSRSSGPPEPIVVHPPSNPPSHSTAGRGTGISPTHTQPPHSVASGANGPNGAHPPASRPSASLSYYSVPPAVQPSRSHSYEHQQVQHHERPSIAPGHQHSHIQPNGQLPTPISPLSPTSPPGHSSVPPGPMRAPSTMSNTGLGGGYVLVDVPSQGYEKDMECEQNGKGSTGNKSTRERGSLFSVFGVGKGGHNRSRSLPMNGMEILEEGERERDHEHEPSSQTHMHPSYTQQIPNQVANPYLTPISPLSPTSLQFPASSPVVVDPMSGPNPPPIVYAPARHHRATHYEPPRIVYWSPRGQSQRHAPYDTQKILQMSGQGQILGHGQGYAYPYSNQYPQQYQHQQYGNSVPVGGYMQPGMAPGRLNVTEHARNGSPGSVRRSQTLQETVRDSGWEEGKRSRERESSAIRASADRDHDNEHEHGGSAGDFVARDIAQTHLPTRSPQANGSAIHAGEDSNPNPVSPSGSHATVPAANVTSEAASAHMNMAGVGTVSARSRSRGRASHPVDPSRSHESSPQTRLDVRLEGEPERGRDRSRSRARGMVYSASAPQPQAQAPHAAMMIPPSAVRERGVRDTPYPTPPGSVSEQLHQKHYQQQQQQLHLQTSYYSQGHGNGAGAATNGYGATHKSAQLETPVSPTGIDQSSPSPGGLISRFRDIYHSSHAHSPISPHVADRDPASSSPSRGRGRARERRRKDERETWSQRKLGLHANGRAKSVDSEKSCSSASTYYVIPASGQKVRIIHPDGHPTTTTTALSRNGSGGGWLKKAAALRPRFLHRDHQNDSTGPNHPSPLSERRPSKYSQAPVLDTSHTPSGGSGAGSTHTKSGKKGGRKLVRRNSTGSAALLAVSREASQGHSPGVDADAVARADAERARDRDVDIVIPGR